MMNKTIFIDETIESTAVMNEVQSYIENKIVKHIISPRYFSIHPCIYPTETFTHRCTTCFSLYACDLVISVVVNESVEIYFE